MKKLTIISGPDQGIFDNIVNFDDASNVVTFITKEKGEITCRCSGVSIFPPAEFDVHCDFENGYADYNSETKTGIMFITD